MEISGHVFIPIAEHDELRAIKKAVDEKAPMLILNRVDCGYDRLYLWDSKRVDDKIREAISENKEKAEMYLKMKNEAFAQLGNKNNEINAYQDYIEKINKEVASLKERLVIKSYAVLLFSSIASFELIFILYKFFAV